MKVVWQAYDAPTENTRNSRWHGAWPGTPDTGLSPGRIVGDTLVLAQLESLKPTQTAVGMRVVNRKRRKLESRVAKRKKMEKLLISRPIPVVRGPGNELFVVDHHHFGLALWQAEVECAYAQIIDDISWLSPAGFWRRMEAAGRFFPYDEDGRRIAPSRLPTWLHALRHDPFRDLAWEVREAGGFRKVNKPYAECRWANFFRERIALAAIRRDHKAVLWEALKLCRQREAADLPGYIGGWPRLIA